MAKKHEGDNLPAIATTAEYPIFAGGQGTDLGALVAENVGDGGISAFDLDRVKVPAGGGLAWTVQGLNGEDSVKDLEGIVLYFRDPRAYWSQDFEASGGGSPPDCSSEDGTIGIGNPGGECKKCPYAQWGSAADGGKGQDCKQMRLLFMMRPGDLLPNAIMLPPTSIQPIKQYFLRLVSKGMNYWSVVTRLTLEKAKSSGGISYSKVAASMVRTLTPEEKTAVGTFRGGLVPALRRYKASEEVAAVHGQD